MTYFSGLSALPQALHSRAARKHTAAPKVK